MRLSIITISFLLSVLFFLSPLPALSGNPDSPAPPDDPASAVFTFEDLYNRLLDGAPGEKRTGAFSEPASGPGDYGHSINEIMSIAPAPESGNAASPENVPEGMIFWCVDPAEGKWGKQTGTMPNQGAVNITPGTADQSIPAGYHNGSGTVAGDANLVPENIAAGKTVFGVAGSAAAASGDAAAGDVLTGRTFSNASAAGVSGTMADNGAVNITPGTANQNIPAGYHNGSGTVAGDANLASGNIRSGATVFGVTGNPDVVDTGTGTAAAGDILSGKTAFVKGATVTGTVSAGNNVTGTSGSLSVTIPDGLYSGSKTAAANDTNLASGNIRSGASIFGVSGTVIQSSGDASAGDVLSGRTFSNASASGMSGSMPNNGAANITPGTANQTIPAGYHNGSGTVAGDANLVSGNIRSGASVFGVAGDTNVVNTSSGDAAAGNIMNGKKAWVDGAEITGSLATQTVSSTAASQPAGNYAAFDLSTVDTDLASGNIKSGVDIFGVTGNVIQSAGDAAAGDVLTGKTFSNAATAGVSGAMTNNGTVNITPGTANQSIPAGYHNGSGTVAGDANLVSGNIRSGAGIFGVSGTVIQSSGDASAGDVLSGKTFSNASAAGVSGAMTDNGAANITPGISDQSIPAGYHNGSGTVAGDANLASGNIVAGKNIFGVTGSAVVSAYPAPVEKTGQTTIYATGDDGAHQKGVTWPSPRFTDNSNGTVTDNLTGLIWLKDANCAGSRNWAVALTDVASLNSGGTMNGNNCGDTSNAGVHQTDWRLPNKNELLSLVHNEYHTPCVPNTAGTAKWTAGDPFNNVQSANSYWSATTYSGTTSYAWIVNMNYGIASSQTKSPSTYHVWPVRGGQ